MFPHRLSHVSVGRRVSLCEFATKYEIAMSNKTTESARDGSGHPAAEVACVMGRGVIADSPAPMACALASS
jgi:hypothetical protein